MVRGDYQYESIYSNEPGTETWEKVVLRNHEDFPIAIDTFFGPIKFKAKHDLYLPNVVRVTNLRNGVVTYIISCPEEYLTPKQKPILLP